MRLSPLPYEGFKWAMHSLLVNRSTARTTVGMVTKKLVFAEPPDYIELYAITAPKRPTLSGSPLPEALFDALDVYVCTSEAEGFSNGQGHQELHWNLSDERMRRVT